MNRLFEFGLKNIDGLRSFRSSIVSKSSGEHLRTAITIDSTIVDQKPGRRNVRFVLRCYFLVNCVILQDFEAVYNKVTAAYVVLIAWFGLNLGDILSKKTIFLEVETQLYTSKSQVWRTPSRGRFEIVIWRSSRLQWRHLYTHLSVKSRGQSRLQ